LKNKIPFILALLIIIPILLLGWLGARLNNQEAIVVEHQAQQLADSQLLQVDQLIVAYFTHIEQRLLQTVNQIEFTQQGDDKLSQQLRSLVSTSPYIQHAFVLDTLGKRVFPPENGVLSLKETEFVGQTQALWSDRSHFLTTLKHTDAESSMALGYDAQTRDNPLAVVTGRLSSIFSRQGSDNVAAYSKSTEQAAGLISHSEYGWTLWQSGVENHTIFWFWDEQRNLIGLKLEMVYLLADLIGQLPDAQAAEKTLGNSNIQILNQDREVVYQWGRYQETTTEQASQAERLLALPLDGWKLVYHAADFEHGQGLQQALYFIMLILLGCVMLGMGYFVYREYTREARLAAQRVTFVNQVSHELKTPLTNICMYADLLESEITDDSNQSQQRYLHVLTSESKRLGRLINNVLSFSRAQQPEQKADPLHFKLGVVDDTIKHVVELFQPSFVAKGIDIELVLQAPVAVYFDAGILEQVLNNLLSNVEKYASNSKQVLIKSSQTDRATHIILQDQGVGIDWSLKEQVFEPFYRASSKLTDGVSGTGIGLGLARDLCRRHAGDLSLQPCKQGACFLIELQTLDKLEEI